MDENFVADVDKWLRENDDEAVDGIMNDPGLLLQLSDDEDDDLETMKKKMAKENQFKRIQMLEDVS